MSEFEDLNRLELWALCAYKQDDKFRQGRAIKQYIRQYCSIEKSKGRAQYYGLDLLAAIQDGIQDNGSYPEAGSFSIKLLEFITLLQWE